MNKETSVIGSITVLIGVVIAIAAFLRGLPEIIAFIITFAVWGLWLFITCAKPRRHHRKKTKIKRIVPVEAQPPQHTTKFEIPDAGVPPLEHLLLLHVNQRISAMLHKTYPQAVWQWCSDDPEQVISKGGVGRIKVCGIADYEYADVTIGQDARIECALVALTPLPAGAEAATVAPAAAPNQQTFDPQVWYETKGRNVLETVVADLNSRGFTSLVLSDNGDICTRMGDKDLSNGKLTDFPGKSLWDKLVPVFEQQGLAAQIQGDCILLSW